jgi:type III secretory pathway component EscV
VKVFLSHSSSDANLARRLDRDLRASGVQVWLDQWEIQVGEEYGPKIELGLEQAEFVLVLVTNKSVASGEVKKEWESRIEQEARKQRIGVIVVRGDTCDMPDFLAQRSHANVAGGSYRLGFEHLLTMLGFYSREEVTNAKRAKRRRTILSDKMLPATIPIALEVSTDLGIFFRRHDRLTRWAQQIQQSIHAEFGHPVPGICIRENETDMPPKSALVMVDEVPRMMLQDVDRGGALSDWTAEKLATNGVSAEPCYITTTGWVGARILPENPAGVAEGEHWEATQYLSFAVQAVIRSAAAEFIDMDVARRLVEPVVQTCPDLVAATVPDPVSWFELTDVLRRLVAEHINIADMHRILHALQRCMSGADATRDTCVMAERVRHALRSQLTARFARDVDVLSVFRMATEIEALVGRGIRRTPTGSYLDIEPTTAQDILAAIRAQLHAACPRVARAPILVENADIRRYLRKLVELEFPLLQVLSHRDLQPNLPIHAVAQITLNSTAHDGT